MLEKDFYIWGTQVIEEIEEIEVIEEILLGFSTC